MTSKSIRAICVVASCLILCGGRTDEGPGNSAAVENASDGGSAAVNNQPDTARGDKDWLAEIKRFIGKRGSEPAEKVFQHIDLLKGRPASRLPGTMAALTGLLGVHCSYCHIPGRWESDEKSTKQVTREQFAMQKTINDRYFRGEQKVNCWTCHRGRAVPEELPSATKK
jgi:hypothetical protein